MKKILTITGVCLGVILLVLVAGAFWAWSVISKPLYEPGKAREMLAQQSASFTPQVSPDDVNRWLISPEIELHHFEVGAGEPVLIIHGGPGYPFEEPIAALDGLADSYRFIYYDQRGCGKSTRPVDRFASSNYFANMQELDHTLGLAQQVADIERIRRILDADQLVLIGHSFGGFLASMYAAEFPEHVKGMILIAPADVLEFPAPGDDLFGIVREELPEPMRADYDDFMEEYLDFGSIFTKSESDLQALNGRFADYYLVATGKRSDLPPAGSSTIDATAGGWMVQAMYLSMGLKHDYREALRVVSAPVLVLHGEDDLSPMYGSDSYVASLPNSVMSVIPGAGHQIFDDQPTIFADYVREFLSGL